MSKYESDARGDYTLIDRKEFEANLRNIDRKKREIEETIQEIEKLTGISINVEKIMSGFEEKLKNQPELSIDNNQNSHSSAKMVDISEDGKRIGGAIISKKDAERAQRIEGKYTKVDIAQDAVRKALGEISGDKKINELTKKLANQISELNGMVNDITNVEIIDTVKKVSQPPIPPNPNRAKRIAIRIAAVVGAATLTIGTLRRSIKK